MTNVDITPAAPRPAAVRRGTGAAVLGSGRLLRIELRHNAMLWLLPVAIALFWYNGYREIMALPPMWNLRAMTLQNRLLLDLTIPVTAAAAWMGSREGRRSITDLVAVTARPRWSRQLAIWAATTAWAEVACLACVAVVYVMTARQASWGGPLWWPVVVSAAGVPALTAIGFAAGAWFPGRFVTPLVTLVVFFGLGFSTQAASGDHSYWQISPLTAGAFDIGAAPSVATFYPYLPDLSIAQLMFTAGLTVAVLGALGIPVARMRWLAAAVTAVGLAAAGTAVALAGTGRLDPHGMIVIPALHAAASDQPLRYTPVCGDAPIPVCVNPAYAAFLPAVTAAVGPELTEFAGLPGAPARLSQVPVVYRQGPGNSINHRRGSQRVGVHHARAGARPARRDQRPVRQPAGRDPRAQAGAGRHPGRRPGRGEPEPGRARGHRGLGPVPAVRRSPRPGAAVRQRAAGARQPGRPRGQAVRGALARRQARLAGGAPGRAAGRPRLAVATAVTTVAVRLHAASRRLPAALVLLAACAVGLRGALYGHWDGYGALQLPLIFEAACAAIIAVTAGSPFGEPERATGRWLPFLRLGATVTLTGLAVGALGAAVVSPPDWPRSRSAARGRHQAADRPG